AITQCEIYLVRTKCLPKSAHPKDRDELNCFLKWTGNSNWVHAVEWSGQKGFEAAPSVSFTVDGEEKGVEKKYGPLMFLKVHDAGHMVPMDQPKAALEMLQSIQGITKGHKQASHSIQELTKLILILALTDVKNWLFPYFLCLNTDMIISQHCGEENRLIFPQQQQNIGDTQAAGSSVKFSQSEDKLLNKQLEQCPDSSDSGTGCALTYSALNIGLA
ncbi:hypothetical protein MTR67_001913, partial [Solanum verrucosum]